jgi:hypothetical protein
VSYALRDALKKARKGSLSRMDGTQLVLKVFHQLILLKHQLLLVILGLNLVNLFFFVVGDFYHRFILFYFQH